MSPFQAVEVGGAGGHNLDLCHAQHWPFPSESDCLSVHLIAYLYICVYLCGSMFLFSFVALRGSSLHVQDIVISLKLRARKRVSLCDPRFLFVVQ